MSISRRSIRIPAFSISLQFSLKPLNTIYTIKQHTTKIIMYRLFYCYPKSSVLMDLFSSLKRTPLWPKFNSSTWELVCSQFANGMLSLLILFCSALYTTSSHWGRKLIFRGALDNQVDSTGFLSQGKFH